MMMTMLGCLRKHLLPPPHQRAEIVFLNSPGLSENFHWVFSKGSQNPGEVGELCLASSVENGQLLHLFPPSLLWNVCVWVYLNMTGREGGSK